MSRGMRLSILGLYQFDNHLFDDMRLPTGLTGDDRQTIINNILTECAELECLFPDYDYCKSMIGLWSKFNLPVWNRIYKASQMVYNPIENYNRTEIETIDNSSSDTHSGTDVNQQTGSDKNISATTNLETNSGNDINTNSITAYDSSQLFAHDEQKLQHGHIVQDTTSGNNTITYGKIDSIMHGEKIDREGNITRENHTTGNIGVTTSQQMLEQEIDISYKLNIIQIICDSFKERFCLLVY